jgi:hypothetical protein
MHSINERETEFAKIAESKEAKAALEKQLDEIIDGPGFKGSQRSAQFLRYIVEKSIAGRFDSLKERVIGMELFGRSPSYDTGEDAIVRVTASDVRKRLLQHYGGSEILPEFRISLPLGSYVPEIIREHQGDGHSVEARDTHVHAHPTSASAAAQTESILPSPVLQIPAGILAAVPPSAATRSRAWPGLRWWLFIVILIAAAGWVLAGIMWKRIPHSETASVPVLPWSAFFTSPHPTHLITSDPDIAAIQRITGAPISVSDYANHNYIPKSKVLPPEVRSICENMMHGDKAATVDTRIAVNVAELAQISSRRIDVVGARSIQFSNLKSDDNFIFLGSPRTDPWFSLFNDKLDFRIVFDQASGEEVIRNFHPATNEQQLYVPTAKGGATGVSYAIIAFVQNPDQNGQVLLLAGLNAEGTQATGKMVTDIPRLTATLKTCGIAPSSPLKHFELLLSVKTMAGSPSEFEVVACHTPAGSAP